MAEHVPTPEQEAIISQAKLGGNLMNKAYAGCSKTTTQVMVANALPPLPALAVAFNKKIADELKKRLPPFFEVMTLNGLGHRAWARAIGRQPELDDKKLGRLVSEVMRESSYRGEEETWGEIRQLVTAAMLAGVVPTAIQPDRGFTPDTPETWEDLASNNYLNCTPQDRNIAREVLIRSIREAQGFSGRPKISFDDQIYCSTCLGGVFPRYPLVLGDEVQDWSVLNREQVNRCASDRLILVGDPLQSIYAFRGADSESMQRLRLLRPEWHDLPLATTFRCPKVVVERQQSHAPGFKAFHTNPEGKFLDWTGFGWTWQSLRTELEELSTHSVAVLCRNNAPLLRLAFRLLRSNVGVQMLGRDIGKGLVTLSKKILPDDSMSAVNCIAAVRAWAEREIALAEANKKPEKSAGITDRAESLIAVLEASGAQDARGLRQHLTQLFARDAGVIVLSSIHRAKGLEWDVVLHLDPWRIPSRYALQQAQAGDPAALQQEHNLRYVAETRSKHTLISASLEDFQ